MVWHTLLYLALLLMISVYAITSGGAPERTVASLWFGNNLLSAILLARSRHMFESVEWQVLAIDIATLAILVGLALHSNRRWLLLCCGMQAGGVTVHFIKLLKPALPAFGYAYGQGIWAYPILLSILLGVIRHRSRLRVYGRDPSWSRSST